MEMTKKQAELTSDTLHRVDMTMRRSVRPSSASSHNSRSRYNIGVISSGGMGRPSSASSSTRSFRNNTSSGKKSRRRPQSGGGANSRRSMMNSSSRLSVDGNISTSLAVLDNSDNLLSVSSPSSTSSPSKYVVAMDNNNSGMVEKRNEIDISDEIIFHLKAEKDGLISQLEKKELEISSQKRLVNTLQDSVKHLNNELETLSKERFEIEKSTREKVKKISIRAKKQLQYQQARCESLEATVTSLKHKLEIQDKELQTNKKAEDLERKNSMEKFKLFQSIVETHEKNMDKLREENLSLQLAFDEVVNSGLKREAWGGDEDDGQNGDMRPKTSGGDGRTRTGGTSPIEWAKNADEMKVGNDKDSFVLPSRALFKSL